VLGNTLSDPALIVSFHPCENNLTTYVTIKGTSALIASSILAAATEGLPKSQHVHGTIHRTKRAYGTKIADAVAPVCLIASSTLANTGLPKCSEPAFLGLVPPTTFVPVGMGQLDS
jgi:hypothetical protein